MSQLLSEFKIPQFDVVLSEIFLLPVQFQGVVKPKTVLDLARSSERSEEEVIKILEQIQLQCQGIEVSPEDLQSEISEGKALSLIDVRMEWEWDVCRIVGSSLWSQMDASNGLQELQGKQVVVICHHGVRSFSAAMYFRSHGILARSLAGGLEKWALEVEPSMARY